MWGKLNKLSSVFRVLQDARLAGDPLPRMEIFKSLHEPLDRKMDVDSSIRAALNRKPVTKCSQVGSWSYVNGEYRLAVKSTLFADFYIPHLFRKIQQGFSVSSWVPDGAEEVL